MTRISILCPTRGRPEQWKRMVESCLNTAENKDNVVLCTMLSKTDSKNYEILNAVQNVRNKLWVAEDHECDGMPTTYKWNLMAKAFMEEDQSVKLFMLGADDMVFSTPGWDTALIEHYEALKEKAHVYSFRDSRDLAGTPHPIVTREWIEAVGYFIPPIFMHWFGDTWTVSMARSNGVFTHLKDYLLTHIKPSDTSAGDETHQRIRRAGWHERDKYVNDTCQHFLEAEKLRLDNYLRQREAA